MPSVEQLSDKIGVRVKGIDLSDPLSSSDFDFVYQSLVNHKVIAFSDQNLSPEQHVSFSKRFGTCDVHSNNQYLLDGFPEILPALRYSPLKKYYLRMGQRPGC